MIVESAMKVERLSRRSEFGGIQRLIKEWRVFGVKAWFQVAELDDGLFFPAV